MPDEILDNLELEIAAHTGCRDRTLAEYIYNVGKKGDDAVRNELSDFPAGMADNVIEILHSVRVGTVYHGIVTGIKPYGAFVKLNGTSGLLHRSQVPNFSQLRSGDSLEVKVTEIKDGKNSLELVSATSDEFNILVTKDVPKFLLNDGVNSQRNLSKTQAQPASETFLNKAATFTQSKVSEASAKLRRESVNAVFSKPKKSTSVPVKGETVLPIHKYRSEITNAIAGNSVVVLVGDTGSGKTTQLTQFLHAAGYAQHGRIIACTQPRRIAAISIAERVALEMGNPTVGELVGYSVRFDDSTTERTEVKFMTDGLLQREIVSDPDMSKYSAIILDEAHERTVATDVLFALLKQAVARRPDLKVIVTSATLDAERFAEYFGGAPVLRIPGRTFPVEIRWAPEPVMDYMEAAMRTVMSIHSNEEPGDILVFLTGQAEIDLAVAAVDKAIINKTLVPVPVYAAIPSEMQSLIFNPVPAGKRKVVFATNIAETSLTIQGIRYVVDTGFSKVQVWDANVGMGKLQVQPISRAQADQRKGRAGRTAPGICYRLYTQNSFEREMPPSTIPEIQRDNLNHTVLSLKAMGVRDIINFDFIDPPPKNSMLSAMHELYLLGALDDEGNITQFGLEISHYPLDPGLATILIKAKSNSTECLQNVLTVVAMLSMPNVFFRPSQPKVKQEEADRVHRQLSDITGDHITLLEVYNKWALSKYHKKWCDRHYIHYKTMQKVKDARNQLSDLIDRALKNEPINFILKKEAKVEILKTLCSGYFENVAKLVSAREGLYHVLGTKLEVRIHPSSSLCKSMSTYVLYSSLILTTHEYMQNVSEIKPEWLVECVPGYYGQDRKRANTEQLQPLYTKYKTHPNEWRVSEQRTTMLTKKKY